MDIAQPGHPLASATRKSQCVVEGEGASYITVHCADVHCEDAEGLQTSYAVYSFYRAICGLKEAICPHPTHSLGLLRPKRLDPNKAGSTNGRGSPIETETDLHLQSAWQLLAR